MARGLAALRRSIADRAASCARNRCVTCRRPAVAAAAMRGLRAAVKSPMKYAGLSAPALHEWCGAAKAGIGMAAFHKHLANHTDGLWRRVLGG